MTDSEILNAIMPTGLGVIVVLILGLWRRIRDIPSWTLRQEAPAVLLVCAVIGLGAALLGQGTAQVTIAMVCAATVAIGKHSHQALPPGRKSKQKE